MFDTIETISIYAEGGDVCVSVATYDGWWWITSYV
jgi:hypothetical protein